MDLNFLTTAFADNLFGGFWMMATCMWLCICTAGWFGWMDHAMSMSWEPQYAELTWDDLVHLHGNGPFSVPTYMEDWPTQSTTSDTTEELVDGVMDTFMQMRSAEREFFGDFSMDELETEALLNYLEDNIMNWADDEPAEPVAYNWAIDNEKELTDVNWS